MTGLIFKDFCTLKKQFAFVGVFAVIMLGVSFFGGKDFVNGFFSGFLMILSFMFPITVLAYDERSKWEKYALTMPISRTKIVLSRYITGFILGLLSCIIILISFIISSKTIVLENLYTTLVIFSIGLTLLSITLPILIKFGVERARFVFVIIAFLPIIIITCFNVIGNDFLKNNFLISAKNFLINLLAFFPLIALALVVISVLISIRIFKKKEL